MLQGKKNQGAQRYFLHQPYEQWRVRRFSNFHDSPIIICSLGSNTACSGLKYSARVRGQSNIFEGRVLPGDIGLPLVFETKGAFFKPNDTLNCQGSQNIVVGTSDCSGPLFKTTLTAAIFPIPSLSWVHNSSQISMSLSFPFTFQNENGEDLTVYGHRESFQVVGLGPVYNLYNPYLPVDRLNIPPEDQGLAITYELLFRRVRSELYWDPTLSLLLFNDEDKGGAPSQSPGSGAITESATINLAAAIAVPLAVVAVIVIIVIFVAVPSVRGFFVPSSVASRAIRKRLAASVDETQVKPKSFEAPQDSQPQTRNKRWTVGQVPPTNADEAAV
jgi:hypothetical protein